MPELYKLEYIVRTFFSNIYVSISLWRISVIHLRLPAFYHWIFKNIFNVQISTGIHYKADNISSIMHIRQSLYDNQIFRNWWQKDRQLKMLHRLTEYKASSKTLFSIILENIYFVRERPQYKSLPSVFKRSLAGAIGPAL